MRERREKVPLPILKNFKNSIFLMSSSCDPLAADIKDDSAIINVRRRLLSGTSELHLWPDNTIQNRVATDKNCLPISTVFKRFRNICTDNIQSGCITHTGVRKRPLSTMTKPYRTVEERNAPTERNVRMRFATSQPDFLVNGFLIDLGTWVRTIVIHLT
nr:hypothetical protein [Tanacetum cinerariifolium]